MEIKKMQDMCHDIALSKGWWEDTPIGVDLEQAHDIVAARLALIHSEVSEALEDVRRGEMRAYFDDNGKPCGFPSEIADVVIRCMDLAGAMGFDLGKMIEVKSKYNKTRANRHGGKKL